MSIEPADPKAPVAGEGAILPLAAQPNVTSAVPAKAGAGGDVYLDGASAANRGAGRRTVNALWRIDPGTGFWTNRPTASLREKESSTIPAGLRFDWRPLFREWRLLQLAERQRAAEASTISQSTLFKLPPWQPPAEPVPFHEFMRRLLEQSGLTYRQLSYVMISRGLKPIAINTLKNDFAPGKKYIPFARLQVYASTFNVDIRTLIYLANLRFTKFSAEDWMTSKGYPAYIEDSGDVFRLQWYKQNDLEHKSLGWAVYEFRKDPVHYLQRIVEVWYKKLVRAKDPRNILGAAIDVELNRQSPTQDRLEKLAKYTPYTLDEIVKLFMDTYYGKVDSPFLPAETVAELMRNHQGKSIAEILRDVFGDQVIHLFMDGRSTDLAKVLAFALKPATPGELVFAIRQSFEGHPSVEEFARQQGITHHFVHVRENNERIVDTNTINEWIRLFNTLGVPIHWLGAFTDDPRVQEGTLGHAMATAAGGNLLSVRRGLGPISLSTLQDLTRDPSDRGASPTLLLTLKEMLDEDVDLTTLYVEVQAGIKKFFPETRSEETAHELKISPADFIEAFAQFNLRDLLISYRLDQNMSVLELAGRLGISRTMTRNYEAFVQRIREDEILLKIAEILAERYLADALRKKGVITNDAGFASIVDYPDYTALYKRTLRRAKRIVYLHFRPEILLLFTIKNPQDDEIFAITEYQFNGWTRQKKSRRLVENAPREICNLLAAHAKAAKIMPAPESVQDLGHYLSEISEGRISISQARKYVSPTEAIPFAAIVLLKQVLPRVDAKRVYEFSHQGYLAYFLGYNGDGKIDYSLPDGWSWKNVNNVKKFSNFFADKVYEKYGSFYTASRALKVSLVRTLDEFKKLLKNREVSERAMAAFARGLGIDRRLIFWFFRRHELGYILGLPDVKGSSGASGAPKKGHASSHSSSPKSQRGSHAVAHSPLVLIGGNEIKGGNLLVASDPILHSGQVFCGPAEVSQATLPTISPTHSTVDGGEEGVVLPSPLESGLQTFVGPTLMPPTIRAPATTMHHLARAVL